MTQNGRGSALKGPVNSVEKKYRALSTGNPETQISQIAQKESTGKKGRFKTPPAPQNSQGRTTNSKTK